jgi:hypothetical protein
MLRRRSAVRGIQIGPQSIKLTCIASGHCYKWRKGSHQNMIGLTVEILHHRGVNLEEFTFSSNN